MALPEPGEESSLYFCQESFFSDRFFNLLASNFGSLGLKDAPQSTFLATVFFSFFGIYQCELLSVVIFMALNIKEKSYDAPALERFNSFKALNADIVQR